MLRALLSWLRGGSHGQSDAGTDEAGGAGTGGAADEAHGDEAAAGERGAAEDVGDEDGDGSGSVWDFVPRSQYLGGYSNSGGIQRNDQERELERIQRQAEEIEGDDVQHEPPAER